MFNPKEWPKEMYEPEKHYPMQLWYFLTKLDVIELKKYTISHRMTMLQPQGIIHIPKWAFHLAIIGVAAEYVLPAKRKEGNFDIDGI